MLDDPKFHSKCCIQTFVHQCQSRSVRLIAEHMSHAGTENGNLKSTYDQLVNYGASRAYINEALLELEALGVIRLANGRHRRVATTYRLTILPTFADDGPPTNEWQYVTIKHVEKYQYDKCERQKAASAKKEMKKSSSQ